jgi:hypothetical protein
MANKRVFDEVHGLTFNGGEDEVLIGGITSIETTQSYAVNVDSVQDDFEGPSDVSQAGQQVAFSVASTDVLKLIDLLIGEFTGAEWHGRESGAATYGKGTLVNPVPYAGRFSAAKGSYATISADGMCRFAAAADTFDDVEGWEDGVAVDPTLTDPSRLWRPQSCTHGSLEPLHVESIGFTIPGRIITDFGDDDMGMTAVDRAGYGVVGVDLTIRDTTKQTGPPTHDIATALIKNGVADLAVTFEGVGKTANKILNLRNLVFRSKRKTTGRDWTGFTLSGVLQWMDPDDPWTKRLLTGTEADRLIYWSDPE